MPMILLHIPSPVISDPCVGQIHTIIWQLLESPSPFSGGMELPDSPNSTPWYHCPNARIEGEKMQNLNQAFNHPSPPQAPRILLASWISFCIIVTRFACIAHKFASSKRCTKNASAASCSACIACDCHRNSSAPSGICCMAISRTYKDISASRFRVSSSSHGQCTSTY